MARSNHRYSTLIGTAALVATCSFSLLASAKLSKTGSSDGGFRANGPAGLIIDGKTSEVEVADDGTNITITVKLGNIDTGISLRNEHTKQNLEVSKYPTAILQVARAELKIGGGEGDASGSLTIHGQTKAVTFHYAAAKSGTVLAIKSSAQINVNDFGIKPPSYLGVTVKPTITIYANFSASDN